MTTRYERAPMPETLNAIAHVGPDGRVVVTLKDSLIEQHNEEAVAMMLEATRAVGWPVEPPKLAAVPVKPKTRAKHAAPRPRSLRVLTLVIVAFFFASAVTVAAVADAVANQQSEQNSAAAVTTDDNPLLHAKRRRPVCAIASCRTQRRARTAAGSAVPARSGRVRRHRRVLACRPDTGLWGRRMSWCPPYAWPWPRLGGAFPQALQQRRDYQLPAAGPPTGRPYGPYARPLTASL